MLDLLNDPSSLDLAAAAGDPERLATCMNVLARLSYQADAESVRAASALVATVLPTCNRLTWDAEYEYGDNGSTFPVISSATLHFADGRQDVAIYVREDGDTDDEMNVHFGEEAQSALERVTDAHPELTEEEQRVAHAYAEVLGIDPSRYPLVQQAVLRIVWSQPGAGAVEVPAAA